MSFWWFSAYKNILEPVSEMRAFFERIVYYSTARLAAGVKTNALIGCHFRTIVLGFHDVYRCNVYLIVDAEIKAQISGKI